MLLEKLRRGSLERVCSAVGLSPLMTPQEWAQVSGTMLAKAGDARVRGPSDVPEMSPFIGTSAGSRAKANGKLPPEFHRKQVMKTVLHCFRSWAWGPLSGEAWPLGGGNLAAPSPAGEGKFMDVGHQAASSSVGGRQSP